MNLIKNHKTGVKGPIWYRGHAKISWQLSPSIFRPDNKKEEQEYLREFKKDALLLVEPIPKEQYEWLFVMRHNHIPTRLLDWTESPLAALYFAMHDEKIKEEEEDGVLWMLLPLELNQTIIEFETDQSLPSFEEDIDVLSPYTPEDFNDPRQKGKQKPIAFLAPRNTKRMQAQQSVFTIHHKIKDPLEAGDPKYLWRYKIPKDAKKNIKSELRLLGFNNFQLFPELPEIYKKIKESETVD